MQTIPHGQVATVHSPALKKQAQVMFPCFQNWSSARKEGKARALWPSPSPPPASLSGGTHGDLSQPEPSRPSPAISLDPRARGALLTARGSSVTTLEAADGNTKKSAALPMHRLVTPGSEAADARTPPEARREAILLEKVTRQTRTGKEVPAPSPLGSGFLTQKKVRARKQ